MRLCMSFFIPRFINPISKMGRFNKLYIIRTHEVCSLYCISFGPIYLGLKRRGNNFVLWWPPSWMNRKFENYRETSRKPDAVVAFYETKNVLQSSVEKIHINLFSLQQFSFLLKNFVKRLDQTLNFFYSRFCRLLKEPKRLIITEGTVPEFQGNPPPLP